MFAVHPLTDAITEPKDCASCGKEARPAGAIRGRLPRLRPTIVGFVCAPCVAWADRWKRPLVTSSGGSVTPEGVDGEADEPPADFGTIDPKSMREPGGFFVDDTPLPEDLGRVAPAENAPPAREPAPTVNLGTVPPGHTLRPAGIVTPVEHPTRWTPALDERLLFGARSGTPNYKIGEVIGFEPWDVDERLEALCPEPRNATAIGAALKRVRGLA